MYKHTVYQLDESVETNKQIGSILIAKSVKVAQEVAEQPRNPPNADGPITEVGV